MIGELLIRVLICHILKTTNPNEACCMVEQALSIARNHKLEIDRARCYNIQGIAYLNKSEYEKALDCCLKALALHEGSNDEGFSFKEDSDFILR